jgi:hypothetical protein
MRQSDDRGVVGCYSPHLVRPLVLDATFLLMESAISKPVAVAPSLPDPQPVADHRG